MHSNAKVWSGQIDEDVKITLERVIEVGEKGESGIIIKSQLAQCLLKAKINFVRVLQQMGKPESEYKQIEDWAVTYIRKNPSLLLPGILVQLLGRPSQTRHPVLVRLGGDRWLEKRVDAALVRPRGLAAHLYDSQAGAGKCPSVDEAIKTLASNTKRPSIRQEERTVAQCRQCGAREPTKKLFRCSGCKYIYYWYELQILMHIRVRADREERAHVESLAKTDAKAAACARDWINWRDHPSPANNTTLSFALGLHRSPARGRTHIVFRQVEYTPLGRDGTLKEDVRDRFEVVSVGVFRAADVYEDIERMLGLDKGQGKVYVEELLEELDSLREEELRATGEIVPILDLTFGKEIDASMGSTATTINMLRATPYDPDWRKRFNKSGRRATPMALKSGVKNAEHDF
ncbi:hypothetical protein EIP86_009166 [Pleurotus ostreatoroseus]|nr:hypothetical protein EIP86_009166 [Pleurotus ostreatoroseus]